MQGIQFRWQPQEEILEKVLLGTFLKINKVVNFVGFFILCWGYFVAFT
jgi:hypothetical protein